MPKLLWNLINKPISVDNNVCVYAHMLAYAYVESLLWTSAHPN